MAPKSDIQQAPWLLQRHLDGEIDLDRELSARYRTMPMMAVIHIRPSDGGPAVATLAAQDGTATVHIDVDTVRNVTRFAFVFRSMLSLNFVCDALADSHRAHWLNFARREHARPVFLWGSHRWDSDYIMTVSHQYFTNLYAFSPHNFEAAARMTPDVTAQLLDWLEHVWQVRQDADPTIPRLTTW